MFLKNSDKKAIQALNYFAGKSGGKINRMKAVKLIWLSDRLHLRNFGRTILSDEYFAIKLGPIPSMALNYSKANGIANTDIKTYRDSFIEPVGQYEFKSVINPDLNVFSQSDIETMEEVFTMFGHFDQYGLSDLSHKFPEWQKFESYFKENNAGRKKINLEDFFKDSSESSEYYNEPEELLNLSKEIFQEGLRVC